jgi:hypothetical protein
MTGLVRLLASWTLARMPGGSWMAGCLLSAAMLLAAALVLGLALVARSGRRVAAAQAADARRIADQESRVAQLTLRLERLEGVKAMHEMEARTCHDGNVIALLEPLLELNDALLSARGQEARREGREVTGADAPQVPGRGGEGRP